MYEKRDIEEMLKLYLKSKAQLKTIEDKIEKNEIQIKFNGTELKENENEVISTMALGRSNSYEIPSGKTNKIMKTTENIALSYRDNEKYTNKSDSFHLKVENEEYRKKAIPLKELVNSVDIMLDSLNNEQKLIIKSYYMYEQKWNYVYLIYIEKYKIPKTINQLKNIRDDALKNMLEVINI